MIFIVFLFNGGDFGDNEEGVWLSKLRRFKGETDQQTFLFEY